MNLNFEGLINPKGQALRKWMSQLLQDRYPKHDQLLERLGHNLITDQDLQGFGNLAIDLFELGYLKCLGECREKFSDLGVRISLVPEKPKN